jgi:hypothetical protein
MIGATMELRIIAHVKLVVSVRVLFDVDVD